MSIKDVIRLKWIRDEEWLEKWYDTEICFNVFIKDKNPLAKIFNGHGLNVLVINDTLYSEKGQDFNLWDKDRERVAKSLNIVRELTLQEEKYIKSTENFISLITKQRIIDKQDLKKIRNIFIALWCIFLSDLGKPFALEIDKRLRKKGLSSTQIEKIKDHFLIYKDKQLPLQIKKLLNYDDLEFMKLVHSSIFIDNYAAELYSKIDSILVKYISSKHKIEAKDLDFYSFTELENLISNNVKLPRKEIKERSKFKIMTQINGKIGMFYGEENFKKIVSLIRNNTSAKLNTFSGIVASQGNVRGNVRVVKTPKDIAKVKQGDILVAPTTRPDLMLAIRRAAAIVTDVGGITSHAAIISREFHIPCIVGTKIATQVLKDNDLIEVDADKGFVKVLKRQTL